MYAVVSTPMKQRKLVVHRVRVEHRLFRFSRKRQSHETGSYTVNASGNARFGYHVTLGSRISGNALPKRN